MELNEAVDVFMGSDRADKLLRENRVMTLAEEAFAAGAAWQREQYEHELSSATYNWERQPGAACQPCENNWTIRGELMKLLQGSRKEQEPNEKT